MDSITAKRPAVGTGHQRFAVPSKDLTSRNSFTYAQGYGWEGIQVREGLLSWADKAITNCQCTITGNAVRPRIMGGQARCLNIWDRRMYIREVLLHILEKAHYKQL